MGKGNLSGDANRLPRHRECSVSSSGKQVAGSVFYSSSLNRVCLFTPFSVCIM